MAQCPDNNFFIKLNTGAHFVDAAKVFDIIMTYIIEACTKYAMTCINMTSRYIIIDNI